MKTFSVLIKPASSLCNLKCKYCFYNDVSDLRSVKSYGIMADTTAFNIIDKAFEYIGGAGDLHFAFQGGEPTLAGLPFFWKFCEYADLARPNVVNISYSIQTNGISIDEDWCELFRKYKFLVGLSFDGTLQAHDFLRIDGRGEPTGKQVLKAADLMKRYKVDFNILSVVTKQLAKHPNQVYDFLKKQNFCFVQFIPCLSPLEQPNSTEPYALSPRLYSSFLKELFRLWHSDIKNGRYISIRLFDNIARMLHKQPPEQCGLLGQCRMQFVIEADGGVYPCDFYVLDEYIAGNINKIDFANIAKSEPVEKFIKEPIPKGKICSSCKVHNICFGGCKRYREFFFSEENFCPYQDFLYESFDGFRVIAAML